MAVNARESSAEPPRILVVDSDPESVALLSTLLREYRLVFARSAFEGLRIINTEAASDAYILESWLPDWNGVQLCREIRRIDPYAPIVFCASAARPRDQARALRAGADAYLIKPVDPKMLLGRLRALIALAELEAENAKRYAQQALVSELRRWHAHDSARIDLPVAAQFPSSFPGRLARAKALKAFVDARGTRARFDRAWPSICASIFPEAAGPEPQ